ncbi:MAG: DUF493 domain-containing protein [Chitinophagales bacterium]
MKEDAFKSLREKLELQEWPGQYMYKFIFKGDNRKIALIEKEFDDAAQIDIKTSSKGKYVSITVKENANSAGEIIQKYMEISKIEGVMML